MRRAEHQQFILGRSQSLPLQQINTKISFKLPKITSSHLNDEQKDVLNARIIKLKQMVFKPIGCSKSQLFQKVRLRKLISKKSPFWATKQRYLKMLSRTQEPQEQEYFSRVYGL